jgi:hypothetical protein
MLWTIWIILLVIWMLGMMSTYTMGGYIHILLLVAVVAVAVQLINRRRVV